jgi:dynein heavy chain
MESTKHFKEWNEDLHVKRQNSIAVMEICSNHVMTNLLLSVKQEMLFLFKNMQSYLENWRKLYSDKGLINPKLKFDLKSSVLDYPSSYYEELYHSQQNRLESFQSMDHSLPSTALGIFKRVDCKAVLKDLNEQSNGILGDISDRMHSVARRKLEAIKANLELLRGSLNGEPESINELKGVLSVINTINSSNMDMNLACRDVQERYEVLKIYKVLVPEHEITLSLSLVSHWQNLVIFARTVDLRLADVKIDLQDDVRAKILDFKNEINRENTRFYASGPASSSISLEGGYELMKEWNIILDGMIATKKDIEGAERLLNIRNTRYDGINKIAESMKELNDIYKVYEKLVELKSTQADCSWIKVDLNVLIDGLSSVEDGFATLSSIKGNVEKNQLLKSSCKELKDLLPILKTLQHDFIQDRHTKELTKLNLHAPKEIEYRREKMTFSDLISLNLWKYPNQVENIIETATQEQKIEMVLREIQKCWASTTLMTKKFEDFFVLCSMDVTTQKLEDDLLQLQAMAGSKFAYFFEQEIEEMEGNLNAITECLDAWFRFQRKWMYLKSIFDGTDIRYQLPEQTAQFEIISRSFQGIMRSAIDSSNIVKSCCKEGRLELFQDLFESLEKCQKSLSQYLESKRISFPRFYFISDEELINILGDADISGIEPYLLKLFDNVKKVKFSGGNIVAIESSEKESFTLDNHIPTDSPVEVWMTRFEEEMKHCLWKATKETIFTYSHRDQTRWLLDNTNIGMCINCASQIWWTWEVEDAFLQLENGRKQSMRDLETKISRKLQEMVQMIRYPLHPLLRQKINSTLIINVHARDVVKALVLESVTSTNQFDWQSQLRFYWDRCEDDIMIKQCLGSFQYGFEYIGLNGRLVITPLTNRCFMTLTQALTFRLGGSPTGPAGTGKVRNKYFKISSPFYY